MSAVTVFLRGVGMCVEVREGARICSVVLRHTLTLGGWGETRPGFPWVSVLNAYICKMEFYCALWTWSLIYL